MEAVKSKDFMAFLFCKPWVHGFCTVFARWVLSIYNGKTKTGCAHADAPCHLFLAFLFWPKEVQHPQRCFCTQRKRSCPCRDKNLVGFMQRHAAAVYRERAVSFQNI